MNETSRQRDKRGFTIQVWVPSGFDSGLRIIRTLNWDGEIAICARAATKAAITSEHLKGKVGTYLLSGDATDFPTIYIGEADTISDRLVTHLNAQDKVFWTSFVALMRIGEGLDKTQIQYLESRLVRLARKANRSKVLNSQNPNAPTLSVQRAEDMETYLDTALAVIGIFRN
jgi:hypothetical protein